MIAADLAKYAEHTLTDGPALWRDLQFPSQRGYAVAVGEQEEGIN